MIGTVKSLQSTYGFITADEGKRDFFFHSSDLADEGDLELAVGDRVTFEEVLPTPERGPRARDVVLEQPREGQISAGKKLPTAIKFSPEEAPNEQGS